MSQSAENRLGSWFVLILVIGLGQIQASTRTGSAEEPETETTNQDPSARLGELSFPNSGSDQAQEKFLIAVKLLHNFEYDEAAAAFRDCQTIDPGFAMAYWGEAMCLNHPLHLEQDLKAGRDVLARLNDIQTGDITDREGGFLRSVKILFGEGDKAERDRKYLEALTKLAEQYPDDHEVVCFQALALLGSCGGKRNTHVYMQAAALLENIYIKNPRHPGVLHYLIHCYDDPIHAPLGLRAARTYASIAENSAHARHMPSHIFLPLGMWDEMIASNESAWQAGVQRVQKLQPGKADYDVHALHALQWLAYGHLQKGNYVRAFELLEKMADIHRRNPTPMCKWYFALMRATYVVNAPDWWQANMEIDMEGVELSATASDLFARGIAAIRTGTTGGERAMKQIIALRTEAEKNIKGHSNHHSSYFDGVYPTGIRAARVMETQLDALILLADGRREQAVQRMKDATAAEERLPVGYGPPLPVKPSHELLGEILLNLRQPKEAQTHFEESLTRTPRRTLSLIGLAAAATDNHDASVSEKADRELRQILDDPQRGYSAWKDLPLGTNAGN